MTISTHCKISHAYFSCATISSALVLLTTFMHLAIARLLFDLVYLSTCIRCMICYIGETICKEAREIEDRKHRARKAWCGVLELLYECKGLNK